MFLPGFDQLLKAMLDLIAVEQETNCLLRQILQEFRPAPEDRLELSIGPVKDKQKKEPPMTTIQLTNLQTCVVTLAPKDRKGKPAKIDGVPVWTVQSGSSTIEPAADGKSCKIITQDAVSDDPGANTTTILAEADADLGAGFVPLDETISVVVSGEPAVALGVDVSAPVDKPDAPALRAAALKADAKADADHEKHVKKAKK